MKKSILVATLLASVMFISCSSDDDSPAQNPLIGTWQLTAEYEDDVLLQTSDCRKNNTVTFEVDKTYGFVPHGSSSANPDDCLPEEGESDTGTWSIPSEGTVSVSYGDGSDPDIAEYTINGQELTFSFEDVLQNETIIVRTVYVRK